MDIDKREINVQVALFFEQKPNIPIIKLAGCLQDEYKVMFENEPQIIPLPPDAPADAPRCIFEKSGGAARLIVSLARMDFFATLKDGSGWKNYMEVIAYTLLKICDKFSIKVVRVGLIVESVIDKEFEKNLIDKVNIEEYHESDEKSISWASHKKILNDSININIMHNIRINYSIQNERPEYVGFLAIDANTNINMKLYKLETPIIKVVDTLLDEIEEKFTNEL